MFGWWVATNFNVSSRQGFKPEGLSPQGPSFACPCLTLAWASQNLFIWKHIKVLGLMFLVYIVFKGQRKVGIFKIWYMRSTPKEPHLALWLVTFLGDFSCLSWASIMCNRAEILICWSLTLLEYTGQRNWPFMVLGQIYGRSNFDHKFCQ